MWALLALLLAALTACTTLVPPAQVEPASVPSVMLGTYPPANGYLVRADFHPDFAALTIPLAQIVKQAAQ